MTNGYVLVETILALIAAGIIAFAIAEWRQR